MKINNPNNPKSTGSCPTSLQNSQQNLDNIQLVNENKNNSQLNTDIINVDHTNNNSNNNIILSILAPLLPKTNINIQADKSLSDNKLDENSNVDNNAMVNNKASIEQNNSIVENNIDFHSHMVHANNLQENAPKNNS